MIWLKAMLFLLVLTLLNSISFGQTGAYWIGNSDTTKTAYNVLMNKTLRLPLLGTGNTNLFLQTDANGMLKLGTPAATGTVTSISQGYGIAETPNPITTTGTIKLDTLTVFPAVRATIPSGTTYTAGYGLSGTTTFNVDSAKIATRLRLQKVVDSLGDIIATKGTGSVTSIANGYGTNGGTIITSGSIGIDTALVATRLRVQKQIDSLNIIVATKGSGTVTKDSAGYGLSGGNVTTSGYKAVDTSKISTKANVTKVRDSITSIGYLTTAVTSIAADYGTTFATITTTGSIAIDTTYIATRLRVQKQVDSLNAVSATKQTTVTLTTTGTSGAATFTPSTGALNIPNYAPGTGTVTNIATTTSTGITGGPITTTGTLANDTTIVSTRKWRDKLADSLNAIIATKQAAGSYLTALTGDGTAAGPGSSTLTLATVNSTTGIFGTQSQIPQITIDAKGRVTLATTVNVLANRLDQFATPNTNVAWGANKITGVKDPTAAQDAATKAYVDNIAAGINPAIAVQWATTTASNTSGLTYANGVSGIGATLTGANNTTTSFDGHTFVIGDVAITRVLIKNDTQAPSGAFNGVYLFTALHTAITGDIFTRALDYDQPSDMNNTGAIPVVNGTLNATTSWVQSSFVSTVGTDPVTFTKFSNAPDQIISGSWAITPNGIDYTFTTTVPAGYAYVTGSLINIYNPGLNGALVLASISVSGTTLTAILYLNTNTGSGSLDAVSGSWGTPALPTINYTLSK